MTGGAWLFFISTGIAGAICCILVMLKAGDSQEKRTKSFIPLCFVVLFWVMVNSAVMVAHHDSLDLLYIRMLRMSVACVVPWLQLWFFLNFTGSPLVNSRPVRWSLITVPSLDILALLTNPLHMLYFTSVEYPRHEEGIFFILHYTGAFCAIAASYAVLLPYILKNFRSYLLVLIAAFGAIAPFAVSVMCILRLFGINYDLTPPAAFLTMATFAYLLYVPRMRYSRPEVLSSALTRITQSQALSAGILEDAARLVARAGVSALNASRIGIWRIAEEDAVLQNITAYSMAEEKYVRQADVNMSDGGLVEYQLLLAYDRQVVIEDAGQPNVLTGMLEAYGPDICALLDAPIRIGGKLVGVVRVEQDRTETFPAKREWSMAERDFASSLADLMAIALTSSERRALSERILDLQDVVLQTVAELVEYRDNTTGCHVERTCFFLRHLMESMAMYGVYTQELFSWEHDLFLMSSQLHDVGKIAIRDEILLKQGALTLEEFEVMKKHTVLGVEIIDKISKKSPSTRFLRYARVLAGTHHERWDGSGYPLGLKGTDIPLMGRLMAIADVYDALTSARPYKKAVSHEDAVRIITRGRGTQFDPELVRAFLLCEQRFKIFRPTVNAMNIVPQHRALVENNAHVG